ncbi:MAG: hypothetical protein CM15mP87_05220 [Candidatus Neomarinimicrobiota bacterium]|nr:MAG: hypothetical protein CM15mP87_05220 [Candidatus Neomarinimicrobiota bacterium]
MELTQQNKTDLLEVVIILAMFFLIIVIYVPVAIWEEEEYYQDLSRYRMQNVYDIESFYSRLTGEYNPKLFWRQCQLLMLPGILLLQTLCLLANKM